MTYQVAQLLFICSRDTMCLDLFLLVHFIMIPKMFVSIITHWFNVLSLAQKWTHNPKKQFLLKYFWTSAFFFMEKASQRRLYQPARSLATSHNLKRLVKDGVSSVERYEYEELNGCLV